VIFPFIFQLFPHACQHLCFDLHEILSDLGVILWVFVLLCPTSCAHTYTCGSGMLAAEYSLGSLDIP
jgi:hypothetical protein